MTAVVLTFIGKLWYFLPAAVANAAPVLSRSEFFKKVPNPPLDFGGKLWDGNRIFGDGKSFFGFLLGVAFGTLTGFLQGIPLTGFLLSTGALFGDVVGAFIKRRMGLPRGKPIFLLDQLNFVAGAVVFTHSTGFFSWTLSDVALLSLIVIPFHRLFGILGHYLKIKREPW
ncbi:MAG: CDP-archaeol synthase [archaeon]